MRGFNDAFSASLVIAMSDIMSNVMTNQFGNYLVQKIIEVASISSLRNLIYSVLPYFAEISMDSHGTRCI